MPVRLPHPFLGRRVQRSEIMSDSHSIPSVIAFEGVDGAGKSTVIAKVATALRERGLRVHLPRSGKEHDSRPTKMIRRLTRDPRNLALSGIPEFLLYCARELQILQEEVKPALSRGEIVLLDRTLLTPQVMAIYGRQLPEATVKAVLDALPKAYGPELTMVFEVHPRTSRIRKRIAKVREQGPRDPGRKGLSGSAFKERVRAGYIETAAKEGYPRFCVEAMTPDELASAVLTCIDDAHKHETMPEQGQARRGVGDTPRWQLDNASSLSSALSELEAKDPAMALYFSRGLISERDRRARWLQREPELVTWSLDPDDPLLGAALELRPKIALSNLAYRPWQGDQDPRRIWAKREPQAVALGLRGLSDPEAQALLEELIELAPGAVVEALAGREDAAAQSLRNAGWKQADVFERANSLVGCVRPRNQRRRAKLAKIWPHLAISSLRGVDAEIADPLLEEGLDKAPKAVLNALVGREDLSAAALRSRLAGTGREVIDSIRGLDDAASWSLREKHLDRWPSTVAWSLWGLSESEARTNMLERCKERAPGDLHMMRRSALFDQIDQLPAWAWPRRGQLWVGDAF